MIINNNIPALNTHRQMGINQNSMQKSMEKLSSGLRINRAGDDAAGLAISEKMRGQIRGLDQASRNSQDGISLIQTAEGALQESHDILQRMRELAVQANNDTNTNDDRVELQKEFNELSEELSRIGNKTEFNTKTLLDGSLGVEAVSGNINIDDLTAAGVSLDVSGVSTGSTLTFTLDGTNSISVTDGNVTQQIDINPEAIEAGQTLNFDKIGLKMSFSADVNLSTVTNFAGGNVVTTGDEIKFQIGANENTTLNIGIADMRAEALGTGTGTGVDNISEVNLTEAGAGFDNNIAVIDQAIKQVSAERSTLGAYQNRLEHTISNLGNASENLSAAESRIRDVDMAKEMMEMTRANILSQASQSMLAQANSAPQSVLQLLG